MSAVSIIDNEILACLPKLNTKQKKTVLTVVKTFAAQQSDWWDEISEAQQASIDKSLTQMKSGKLTSHAEVMKKYKK